MLNIQVVIARKHNCKQVEYTLQMIKYTLQIIKTVSLSQQMVNYQYCFYPKDKLRISKLYDKWLPKKIQPFIKDIIVNSYGEIDMKTT